MLWGRRRLQSRSSKTERGRAEHHGSGRTSASSGLTIALYAEDFPRLGLSCLIDKWGRRDESHDADGCGCLFLTAADPAVAQDYPNRPIAMVVPFAAGGP